MSVARVGLLLLGALAACRSPAAETPVVPGLAGEPGCRFHRLVVEGGCEGLGGNGFLAEPLRFPETLGNVCRLEIPAELHGASTAAVLGAARGQLSAVRPGVPDCIVVEPMGTPGPDASSAEANGSAGEVVVIDAGDHGARVAAVVADACGADCRFGVRIEPVTSRADGRASLSDLAEAVAKVVDSAKRPRVLHLSLGWDPRGSVFADPRRVGPATEVVRRAIEAAACSGALVIASAGQDLDGALGGAPSPIYPAGFTVLAAPEGCPGTADGSRPLVVAVGAATATGSGDVPRRPDPLMRPGGAPSLYAPASPRLQGASAAAAAVSGWVAARWSSEPSAGPASMLETLLDAAVPFPGAPAVDLLPATLAEEGARWLPVAVTTASASVGAKIRSIQGEPPGGRPCAGTSVRVFGTEVERSLFCARPRDRGAFGRPGAAGPACSACRAAAKVGGPEVRLTFEVRAGPQRAWWVLSANGRSAVHPLPLEPGRRELRLDLAGPVPRDLQVTIEFESEFGRWPEPVELVLQDG